MWILMKNRVHLYESLFPNRSHRNQRPCTDLSVPSKVNTTRTGMRRRSRRVVWTRSSSTPGTTSPALTVTWPCSGSTVQSNLAATWYPSASLPGTLRPRGHWLPCACLQCRGGAAWPCMACRPPSYSAWRSPGCPCRSVVVTPVLTSPGTCSVLVSKPEGRTPARVTAAVHWSLSTARPGS